MLFLSENISAYGQFLFICFVPCQYKLFIMPGIQSFACNQSVIFLARYFF